MSNLTKNGKKIGRPTKYCPEILAKAEEYLDTWQENGDAIPQLASLALHIGITPETVKQWKKEEDKEAFSLICARVMAAQQKELINMGLTRKYDNSLTKLLLMKHGYSDRQEVDMTSSDGSMSPSEDALKAAKKKIMDEFGD